MLVYKSSAHGNFRDIFSAYVFGFSLIILYSASTIYHSVTDHQIKNFFRVIDHTAIFVLIAGTYTPFLLISLYNYGGLTFFILIWVIGILGIVYKIFFTGKSSILSTLLYLLMGWIAIFRLDTFMTELPTPAIWWIFAGGIFYTVGVIFYHRITLKYNHSIWHIFVMAGSLSHFIAIYYYVLPG